MPDTQREYKPYIDGPQDRPRPRPRPSVFDRDHLPSGRWDSYKRMGVVRAVRVEGPFTVDTREGQMGCPDGWLALDSNDDPYPIAADVFAATYLPKPLVEVDGQRLMSSTDAAVWTEEFMKLVDADVHLDWGLMVSWFANAIEAGRRGDDTH